MVREGEEHVVEIRVWIVTVLDRDRGLAEPVQATSRSVAAAVARDVELGASASS